MSEYSPGGGQQGPQQGGASWGPPPPYQESAPYQQQPPAPREAATQQWGTDDYSAYESGYEEPEGGGEIQLASIPRRAVARLADNLLVAVFGFALILPVTIGIFGLDTSGKKASTDGAVWNWPIIITLFAVLAVLPFAYEAVQLTMSGRTLGKRLMKLGIVRQDPAGTRLTTAQAILRPAVHQVGYQLGFFFFLILAVKVWDYAFYGVALVVAGTVMAYLWAIWDVPFRQAVHDRLAGTLVVDEREYYEG
ncbi:RDD family protein [Actinomadura rubteroloni]|uniref:RDD family protein n=1 Tax=Actinomadura rubteroloni TaxID=1926885 RepID=A0A2P4UP76_9ACTN|nr:RDD family protein [Actinomadura rubteroloni]POM26860.1 RDD family protein [Actinomadura rubteroloni]